MLSEWRRWFIAGVVVVAGGCWGTVALVAASGNGIAFSLHLSGQHLAYGGRSEVFSVRMSTRGSGETAGVGLTQSGWPDPGVGGSPLVVSHETLSGAGRVTGHFASGGAASTLLCSRGAAPPDGGGVDVSLPPNSTTSLSYTVRLAAPPWPGMRPTIGAYAYLPATDTTGGGTARQLGVKQLIPAGVTGDHVTLSDSHARGRPRPGHVPSVAARRAVLISGRTDPSLANVRVLLSAQPYLPAGLGPLTGLGNLRTNSRGRFALQWHPNRPRTYMITAELPHPSAPMLPERSCDLTISTR